MSRFNLKSFLKIGALIILIFFTYIFFKLIAIPVTEYPYYFFNLCRSKNIKNSDEKIVFLIKNQDNEPLSCKKIRIEEESWCTESPCPDFSIINKFKTSNDGTLIISKEIFNNYMESYVDGPPGVLIPNENKEFLFHVEGNYNKKITFKEIMDKAANNEEINLELDKQSDEICSNPRWWKNYCDGH
jgi:hypothetical protein